jgi:hypothetical protein
MHFTLVFSSHESYDLTVSLTFEPCPMWRRGGKLVLNPHPEFPEYREGDSSEVMHVLGGDFLDGLSLKHRKILVVKHDDGHGTTQDLKLLLNDIANSGFAVRDVDF